MIKHGGFKLSHLGCTKEKKDMANLNPDKWRQDSTYTPSKTYILNSIV
jgi:hypothetical protein